MINYTKHRHLNLINQVLIYKNQTLNFHSENPKAYSELVEYQIRLQDHLFWVKKEKFVSLMENFINSSLELEEFNSSFTLLWPESMTKYAETELDLQQIENFQISSESYNFCSWIIAVYRQLEEL